MWIYYWITIGFTINNSLGAWNIYNIFQNLLQNQVSAYPSCKKIWERSSIRQEALHTGSLSEPGLFMVQRSDDQQRSSYNHVCIHMYLSIFCKELSRWPQQSLDFLFADLTSLTFSMHFNTVQPWPGGSWKCFWVSNWRNLIIISGFFDG